MEKKPSNFIAFPSSSVSQKYEAELVALNIMKILKRTGDEFRPLTWEEYEAERKKDSGFTSSEKSYFDSVIHYCKNADTAHLFSPVWK